MFSKYVGVRVITVYIAQEYPHSENRTAQNGMERNIFRNGVGGLMPLLEASEVDSMYIFSA